MVPIALYDELRITVDTLAPHTATRVTSDSEAAPGGAANLAYRAATLFLARSSRAASVAIDIRKCIPVGSGLGGGSSDAAAVLLALNRLLGAPFSIQELGVLGAEIGADVTFFVHGFPARVAGVGEQVSPVSIPSVPLVICWDGFLLSTKLVYSRVDLSLTTLAAPSSIAAFVSGQKPSPDLLVNDLETAAAQIHPEVLSLKARLMDEGAMGALMSGSGSAVFGMWPDGDSAQNAAMKLRQQGLWAAAVETLTASPAAVR